jgi:imidazole glycerol-phosphate synthase subunit HisH
MADVVVIDSGGANLASLGFALARLGVESTVTTDPERIRRATHVLLPGVALPTPD